jgi:hypothetical protein
MQVHLQCAAVRMTNGIVMAMQPMVEPDETINMGPAENIIPTLALSGRYLWPSMASVPVGGTRRDAGVAARSPSLPAARRHALQGSPG